MCSKNKKHALNIEGTYVDNDSIKNIKLQTKFILKAFNI